MNVSVLPARSGRLLSAVPAQTAINSTDSTSGAFGKALRTLEYTKGAFQVTWSGVTGGGSGVCKLQVSENGIDWDDKSGVTVTVSGSSGTKLIPIDSLPEEFVRCVYTPTTITGGLVNVYFGAKAN